jgi:hypothetical protein
MGILNSYLTMGGDKAKYDPLKEDALKNDYDPVGKIAGKRVKTYDQEYGFALFPEEKAAAEAYKGQVDKVAGQQSSAIGDYQSAYSKATSEADAKAQGILDAAKGQAAGIKKQTISTIPINVVGEGNKIEGTYYLPKEVATKIASEKGLFTNWGKDGSFNVSVKVEGGRYIGQELHDSFRSASEEVNAANENGGILYDAAKKAGDMQIGSIEQQIAAQKEMNSASYDQNISQGNQALDYIKGKWTTFLGDQRTAFQEGIKTNNGGIAALVSSGALVLKGSKK